MQLFTFITVTFFTCSAVLALPPQYSPGYGPAPVWSGPGPLHSVSHKPWQRHLEVREAQPEAEPEAMPEAIAEPIPDAAPHAVPDAEFVPTLVQRSPASEPDAHHHKAPPSYGPGPVPGPIESVHHKAWKRPHPAYAADKFKRDVTELIEMQEHQNAARDANADVLEAREPTPTKPKWPPGYHGFPVGPIESVSHQPWKRHVEQNAMPEAQPDIVLTA